MGDSEKNFFVDSALSVMKDEYKATYDELMHMHSRQERNVIQSLIMVGAVFLFVVNIDENSYAAKFVLPCLMLIIPLICYTLLFTAASTYARGRQLSEYIANIEIKVNTLLRSHYGEYYKVNPMGWINWFYNDNNRRVESEKKKKSQVKRLLTRFDLVASLILVGLIVIISIFLGLLYNKDTAFRNEWICFDDLILINIVLLIIYSASIIMTIKHVREMTNRALDRYKDFEAAGKNGSAPKEPVDGHKK